MAQLFSYLYEIVTMVIKINDIISHSVVQLKRYYNAFLNKNGLIYYVLLSCRRRHLFNRNNNVIYTTNT